MMFATLFLLCCISFALVLKRQKAMVYAHNGQATALDQEDGRPTGSPNLLMETQWLLGGILATLDSITPTFRSARQFIGSIRASVIRLAAKIATWTLSLSKGKTKIDSEKFAVDYEDEEDQLALVQVFVRRIGHSLDCGKTKEKARSELLRKFPLNRKQILEAYEQVCAKKR